MKKKSSVEVLTCLCGSDDVRIFGDYEYAIGGRRIYYVCCGFCDMCTNVYKTKRGAINAWNRTPKRRKASGVVDLT